MLVPKPKAVITCGQLFEDYVDWCKNENLKCETKGLFSKKLGKMFKPRDKKLNGNTVYDVAIPADCDNVFVDSDNDGLKRKLISADNENKRLSKQLWEYEQKIKDQAQQIKDLQKAKDKSKHTKDESQLIKDQAQKLTDQAQTIKDLQKVVFDLQAKKASKQTKSERVEQRTVNAIQTAIDKHLQDDDCGDEENSQSDDDSNDDSQVNETDSDDDDDHSFVIDV
jgi:myosin heavy subunit